MTEDNNEPTIADLIARLDAITTRLDLIENRMNNLEDENVANEFNTFDTELAKVASECERQFRKIANERNEAPFLWWSP